MRLLFGNKSQEKGAINERELLQLDEKRETVRKAIAQRHQDIDVTDCIEGVRVCNIDLSPLEVIANGNPQVTYIRLAAFTRTNDHMQHVESPNEFYLRVENPLYLQGSPRTVEEVSQDSALQQEYFNRLLVQYTTHSRRNEESADLWEKLFLGPRSVDDKEYSATIQLLDERLFSHEQSESEERFLEEARKGFSTRVLRTTLHRHKTNNAWRQSINQLIVAQKGQTPKELESILSQTQSKPEHITTHDESANYSQGADSSEYFENHPEIYVFGVPCTLERVIGRNNVAQYRMTGTSKHVAVKVESFASEGDLVERLMSLQVAMDHGSEDLGRLITQVPSLAQMLFAQTTATAIQHERKRIPENEQEKIRKYYQEHKLTDTTAQRFWGPLLLGVDVDYDKGKLITFFEWAKEGTYDDASVRQRLVQEASTSYLFRLAAGVLKNGLDFMEKGIFHGDIKPANLFDTQQYVQELMRRKRREGFGTQLTPQEKRQWVQGERPMDGDFGTVFVGVEGCVRAQREGLAVTDKYTTPRFIEKGLHNFGQVAMEQDAYNRIITATEFIGRYVIDTWQTHRIRAMRERGDELIGVHAGKHLGAANKSISPLFQEARDNANGVVVWARPSFINMMRGAFDYHALTVSPQKIMQKLSGMRSALIEEAKYLEEATRPQADAGNARVQEYLTRSGFTFNPYSGLVNNMSEMKPTQENMRTIAQRTRLLSQRSLGEIEGMPRALHDIPLTLSWTQYS